MRILALLPLAILLNPANAQFFNAIRNLFSPVTNLFGGGRFTDDGTQSPQATGREELFPSDCGRNPNDGTGKLCFPDGLLCQNSECYFPYFYKLKTRGLVPGFTRDAIKKNPQNQKRCKI